MEVFDFKLIITLHSDKEHRPITLSIGIPQELAVLMQNQPVTSTTFTIGYSPKFLGKLPLVDYKGGDN